MFLLTLSYHNCGFSDDVLLMRVFCFSGLTTSNYTELTEVYSKYRNEGCSSSKKMNYMNIKFCITLCVFLLIMSLAMNTGLEILGFPCNQFGGQEPGSNEDIQNFVCTRFKAEYPIFDKVVSWTYWHP